MAPPVVAPVVVVAVVAECCSPAAGTVDWGFSTVADHPTAHSSRIQTIGCSGGFEGDLAGPPAVAPGASPRSTVVAAVESVIVVVDDDGAGWAVEAENCYPVAG